ncbi:cell division protein FtsW (lipid II flippase) [Oikeobacillus pervagus]|uniref:Cell division protein FtsW (Lipid II flippase) n=1 Tax=Oikeobacillus pervagus TaxID=1325931 RepID=A0AAJ1WJX3_9BACI|nr:FtsW/RodA/SpoVE family cell cycle protein [Oikeobacillus pervagus]MDQ0216105.1 cell division protein FtsW (lipid II flippase) [Oikeobacillus pervagus]
MKDKHSFFQTLLSNIRSREARQYVRMELENHMEHSIQSYMKQGKSREEAEIAAVEQMGEPSELGVKLNKLHKPKVDWTLLGLFAMAIGLGFVPFMVLDHGDFSMSMGSKIVSTIVGITVMFVCMLFDYRKLEDYGWYFYMVGIVILLIVFNYGFSAITINGTHYLNLLSFSFDSTIVLPFFFFAWASFLMKSMRIWQLILVFVLPLWLFLGAPSLTNATIYSFMVLFMLGWSIRKNKRAVFTLSLTICLSVIGFLLAISYGTNDYQKERWLAFLHPEAYPNSSGYMYLQLKKLLGEAEWFGKSLESGSFHLPEAHTNLVLVTLTYSLGWLFLVLIVMVLAGFSFRMIYIIKQIKDPYGQLLVVGGVILFTVSFLFNVFMIAGLAPLTGMFVPFISYGTIVTLLYSFVIGVVLSVFRRKDFFIPTMYTKR